MTTHRNCCNGFRTAHELTPVHHCLNVLLKAVKLNINCFRVQSSISVAIHTNWREDSTRRATTLHTWHRCQRGVQRPAACPIREGPRYLFPQCIAAHLKRSSAWSRDEALPHSKRRSRARATTGLAEATARRRGRATGTSCCRRCARPARSWRGGEECPGSGSKWTRRLASRILFLGKKKIV